MKINSTKFKGLKIIQGKTHFDSRGAFRELFLKNKNKSFQGIFWCMSKSRKNVVRGLHIQKKINQAKFNESKCAISFTSSTISFYIC